MIPQRIRKQLAVDPDMQECKRWREQTCKGRITWEHCWLWQNKQIQETFAIIPLCWKHHLININKELNQYYSIKKATQEDFDKYPRIDWKQKKIYLLNKYDNPENKTS